MEQPIQAPVQSDVQSRKLLGMLCGTFHRISTDLSDIGGEPGTGAEVGCEAEMSSWLMPAQQRWAPDLFQGCARCSS
jgi:hypothetical protein